MEVLKDKVGATVKNCGSDIAKALGVMDVKHIGNFEFSGRLWGAKVIIKTEPTDESENEIRVSSIRLDELALQREGIYRNKVGFNYSMQKANKMAESYIALPVSAERYEQLFGGLSDTSSKVFNEVREALKSLAELQGNKLIDFKPEFTFTEAEDND